MIIPDESNFVNPGSPPCLLPLHLLGLKASGLSDETIAANGLHSVSDPAAIGDILHWSSPATKLGDCLAIPFRGPDGTPLGYVRLRPDRPRVRNGKPAKYESPRGVRTRVYFPAGCVPHLADPAAPIVITEGEKKALKATQDGFPTIGLVGVSGWSAPRPKRPDGKKVGRRELHGDLAGLAWKGRVVFVVFDSDSATKPEVGREESQFVAALKRAGARVKAVSLPHGDDGTKVGLDDFLVRRGAEAFRGLLAASQAGDWDPSRLRPGEAWDDPHRLARMLAAKYRHGGEPTLVGFRSEYLVWAGGGYAPKPDGDLAAEVAAHCREVFEADVPERERATAAAAALAGKQTVEPTKLFKVTTTVRSNVLTNLAGIVTVPDAGADPPFWIGDTPADTPHPAEILAAPNGLWRLDDLAAGRGPFVPPTPRLFTRNPLPFAADPDAPAPRLWLSCLAQWFPHDPASIAGLQEWFGYLLTADIRMHAILLLVGPPRSGKGTIIRVLTGLVGTAGMASMTLAALGEDFAMESLIGKTVCVIPDARLGRNSDAAHVVERLLSISGGDAQTVNRKHRPRVTTTLNVRFAIATNEIPRLPDASGALASRFHILHTPTSFLGREDRSLADKLLAERPGILKWAAEGWVRLLRRVADGKGFTENAAAAAHKKILADLSSPVRAFVRECCSVGPKYEVERGELYLMWKYWNAEQNREPTSHPIFGKDLKAAFPYVTDTQPWRHRGGEKVKVRLYVGIGLTRHDWGEPPLEQAGTCSGPLHASGEGEGVHGEHSRLEHVPACSSVLTHDQTERDGIREFGGG